LSAPEDKTLTAPHPTAGRARASRRQLGRRWCNGTWGIEGDKEFFDLWSMGAKERWIRVSGTGQGDDDTFEQVEP
jgi:hypothetical protein